MKEEEEGEKKVQITLLTFQPNINRGGMEEGRSQPNVFRLFFLKSSEIVYLTNLHTLATQVSTEFLGSLMKVLKHLVGNCCCRKYIFRLRRIIRL